MDFKKIKVAENRLVDLLLFESNFGWVKDSYDGKTLVLSRNVDTKYAKKLNKIEKDIIKIRRVFPFGSILYLLIAGGFAYLKYEVMPRMDFAFLDSFGDKKEFVLTIIGYVLLGICAIFAFVGLLTLLFFFITVGRRKKLIERKIDLAKEITGLYCKVPLKSCIKEPGPTSNILSKMNF